jgi:lipopolysaccharide transport system permease protein
MELASGGALPTRCGAVVLSVLTGLRIVALAAAREPSASGALVGAEEKMTDRGERSRAPGSAGKAPPPAIVLRPHRGWRLPNLGELFAHRDLLFFLTTRNVKVRYRQTLLGGGWAIAQPLMTMAMLTLVFDKLLGVQSAGVPYWIFSLTGLVFWIFLSQTISGVSSSIVGNSGLIEKVYFPRLAIPAAAVGVGLLDFVISFTMLAVVLAVSGWFPGFRILLCLLVALLGGVLALGLGAALAALSVRFRDIQYALRFALQLWLFATPVAYPIDVVPQDWRFWIALNPATGLVELFRWAALGTPLHPWPDVWVSLGSTLVLLVGGLLVFRRMERSFADVI